MLSIAAIFRHLNGNAVLRFIMGGRRGQAPCVFMFYFHFILVFLCSLMSFYVELEQVKSSAKVHGLMPRLTQSVRRGRGGLNRAIITR